MTWPNGSMARAWTHVRGAPNHPQTRGKIERWHQTLKNRVLLENDYLPGALEQAVKAFVEHYNHDRYHAKASGNISPADACFGRDKAIPSDRSKTKEKTMKQRGLINQKRAA